MSNHTFLGFVNCKILNSFFKLPILLQVDSTDYWREWLGGFIFAAILIFIAYILMYVFFLITLSKTLKAIQPVNREMEPGEVFLLFIPLFNYVWMFIVVNKLSNSIEKELKSRNITTSSKPTFGIGLAVAILSASFFVFTYMFPYGAKGIGLAYIICFISYWSNVSGYKNKLESLSQSSFNNNQFSQNNNNNNNNIGGNQGYQGGYSGGHNNHGGNNNYNNSNQNNSNQFPNNNDGEYKSGDLYK